TPAPSTTAAPTPPPPPTSTPGLAEDRPTALDLAATEVFAVLEEFLEELGPRESATSQESAAAQYLQNNLQELGYETELQPFTAENLSLAGLGLTLNTPEPEEYTAIPLDESGLGDVSGTLTPVGLAMPDDIPNAGLEGRIALAKRGVITFQAKAENVFAAGAVGLVIYNNVFGLFRGVLATQPDFPVISLSRRDGEAIEELLAESAIEASIKLTFEELPSQNVIAEKKGPGEAVVVLGGHFDTVPGVSGANDNASGTAVLLALARMLAEVDLPFTLRIVPFGSEELGLLGSRFYLQSLSEEELENTKVMLNFDALGSGSGVSVFGDGDFTELASAIGDDMGVDVAVTRGLRGGSSDFASFRAAGVPYLMFFGADVSRIHSERDTLEFVRPEMLGGAVAVAAALLQSPEFADLIADR
ncbi:MAG: M20/M25/M40 family metallo-hydrolase, partial [Chloroflexi bacterium]|nr:M20/M25/M40 family metallo-hydrolase [Chloroflexota bacterium]